MAYRLAQEDLQVMEAAARVETGGMSAFTSYYFAPIHGTPRWDLVATSPDTWDLAEGEFVPWVPLAWQMAVAYDKRLDATIIAGFGSGKTVGIGAVFTYWCCMIPNFKAMDAAPVGWQAKQMYDAIRQESADYDNRRERPTRLSRLITRVVGKPYPKITFHNGSTIEFMSADNPYLTADQLRAIERRIKDLEKRKQLTKSERPLPRGNEFTPELLEPCQSREMDDVMRHARENNLRGYYVEEAQRAVRYCGSCRPTSSTATC